MGIKEWFQARMLMALEFLRGRLLNYALCEAEWEDESVFGQAAAWLTFGDSPSGNELHQSVVMFGEASWLGGLNKLGVGHYYMPTSKV